MHGDPYVDHQQGDRDGEDGVAEEQHPVVLEVTGSGQQAQPGRPGLSLRPLLPGIAITAPGDVSAWGSSGRSGPGRPISRGSGCGETVISGASGCGGTGNSGTGNSRTASSGAASSGATRVLVASSMRAGVSRSP